MSGVRTRILAAAAIFMCALVLVPLPAFASDYDSDSSNAVRQEAAVASDYVPGSLLTDQKPVIRTAQSAITDKVLRVMDVGSAVAEPGVDSSLSASIAYTPVGKGGTAVLAASIAGLFQGEQFWYEWQESSDGGTTWSSAVDTSQTLRVPTAEGTVGRMYRVVATTSTGRTAVSEPVTIVDSVGFSVVLEYSPPIAGEMALFTSRVSDIEPSEIVDYLWEWSEDGGVTWREVSDSRGMPTLSIQTDPVGDSDGDDDAGGDTPTASGTAGEAPAPGAWVRVRVLATGGRVAVSNAVMMTVHVSGDPDGGQAPVKDVSEEPADDPGAPGSGEVVDHGDAPSYKPIEGDASVFTLGSEQGLVLKFDGPASRFDHLETDGVRVSESCYSVSEGSTVIALNADYLNGLGEGDHTVTACYDDGGRASATLAIKAQPSGEQGSGGDASSEPGGSESGSGSQASDNGNDKGKASSASSKPTGSSSSSGAKSPKAGDGLPMGAVVLITVASLCAAAIAALAARRSSRADREASSR